MYDRSSHKNNLEEEEDFIKEFNHLLSYERFYKEFYDGLKFVSILQYKRNGRLSIKIPKNCYVEISYFPRIRGSKKAIINRNCVINLKKLRDHLNNKNNYHMCVKKKVFTRLFLVNKMTGEKKVSNPFLILRSGLGYRKINIFNNHIQKYFMYK
jgi:hypothetical protein